MLDPAVPPGDTSGTDDYAAAELFRGRRMVLSIQCGVGEFLGHLAELGVPGVGLDTTADLVIQCRARQFPSWAGTWQVIANHRQKFDGIMVPLDRLAEDWRAELPAMLATLAGGLLPRGLLVLSGGADCSDLVTANLPAGLPTDLAVHGNSDRHLILTKQPRPEPKPGPRPTAATTNGDDNDDDDGIIIGPYADAFVGCENVLELGCGRGRFLDHLRVRDVPSSGIEADREMAGECSSRDLAVELGGVDLLRDRPARYDGIYLGNLVEPLPLGEVEQLLRLCRHALRPNGRVLVRCSRKSHRPSVLRDLITRLGFTTIQSATLPGDRRDYFVTGIRPDQAAAPAPEPLPLPLPLPLRAAPAIYTRDREIDLPLRSLHDLERFERKIYSQGGEDGVLAAIFEMVGTTNRYYVELGCGDGLQCDTTNLRRQGWQGLLVNGVADSAAADAVIHKEWITAENIHELLRKHRVPEQFDLLSIDLDGNDYWVWEAIRHRPRVVVAEYNGNLAADQSLTIAQDPNHLWDGSDYYGASLLALQQLAERRGYVLVYCTGAGVNAFFVHRSLTGNLQPRPIEEIFRPANYWYRGGRQFPDLSRAMIDPGEQPSRAARATSAEPRSSG